MGRWMLLVLCLLAVLPLPPAPAHAAGKARLRVVSRPARAAVRINGQARGKTPLTLRGLAPGEYTLELRRAGYLPWTRTLPLKPNVKTTVRARLARDPAADAERARRRRIARTEAARAVAWQKLGLLPASPRLKGPGLLGGQAPQKDPISGLYTTLSFDLDDELNLVIRVLYFLDAAGTRKAGEMTVVNTGDWQTVEFSFTGGDLAGASGRLEGPSTPQSVTLDGTITLPDGTPARTHIETTLTGDTFQMVGTVDADNSDGTTSHWEVRGRGENGRFEITTSDGSTLVIQVNPDGSGQGTLTRSDTGEVLARFSWSRTGEGEIVYPDGRRETFSIG